jgi:hypothetical protein
MTENSLHVPGTAVEFVLAAIVELSARPGDEVLDRGGREPAGRRMCP